MPRIPIIEQTVGTPMPVGAPRAQGLQHVSSMGNAPQILGNALTDYASSLQQKENADAVANTGKPLADADVHWKQYLVDTSATTQDGGLVKEADGKMVGMRAKTEKDFDAWSSEFMAGISNPKAKLYAQEHINRLRTSTLTSALTFEARAGVENRSAKVGEAVQTWASAAAKDDSNVAGLIQSAKVMIANSGFDEATRNEKARQATQQIVEAAVMGNIERNPRSSRAALIASYGIDPTSSPAQAIKGGGGFQQAVAFTLQAEGGLNPADTNGTPSNFGINQQAHPGIDVKKLTKTEAAAIYKKDYWDFIGGDALSKNNPGLAIAAFDTAVLNKQKAKEFLAASGGDAGRFMTMREGFLASLLAKDPAKYGKYERAWNERNANLRKQVLAASADDTAPPADTMAPSMPYSPGMAALVAQLPPERLQPFISHATTLANQQTASYRSQVESTQADHLTAFRNGETVAKPMTQDEYVGAYGPVDGPERYKNYRAVQTMGHDISTMKAMPPEQMNNLVERYRPDPDSKGYALATERYKIMVEARDQVNNARFADPMAYAMGARIGNAAPLNLQKADEFGAELAKRQGIASTMAETYGTPFTLLTKNEVSAMSAGFGQMSTGQKMAALSTIQKAVTNPAAYRSIMGQIAPDSPVTAMAGMLLAKTGVVGKQHMFSADEAYRPQDVAATILEGEALINPTKGSKEQDGKGKVFPMPKEQDIRGAFNSAVGSAYAGAPKIADFDYQAVKAYYAGKAARMGDISGETNSKILQEAITAVTGGVSDINGNGQVVRPWGMSEREFKDRTRATFDNQMQVLGLKGSAVDQFGVYGLQTAGEENKYLLRSGTGYLTDKTGKPVVLDVTPMAHPTFGQPVAAPVTTDGGRSWSGTIKPEDTASPITTKPKTK